MDRFIERMPGKDWYWRRRGKVAGAFMGGFGTLLLVLFLHVAVTGEPLGAEAPPADVVYPIF